MRIGDKKPVEFWSPLVLAAVLAGAGITSGILALVKMVPPDLKPLVIVNEQGGGLLPGPYLRAMSEFGVHAGGLWTAPLRVRSGGLLRRVDVLQVTNPAVDLLGFDGPAAQEMRAIANWRPGGCAAIRVNGPVVAGETILRVEARSCVVVGEANERAKLNLRALGFRPDWVLTAPVDVETSPAMNVFLGLVRPTDSFQRASSLTLLTDASFYDRYPSVHWAGAQETPVSVWIAGQWRPLLRAAVIASTGFAIGGLAIVLVTGLGPLLARRREFAIRRALGANERAIGHLLARETLRHFLIACVLAMAILQIVAARLGTRSLLAPGLVGILAVSALLCVILWCARWLWVSSISADWSGNLSPGALAGFVGPRRGAAWATGALVVAQGTTLVILLGWATGTAADLREATTLRLTGELNGVVGIEVFRPMQEQWLTGRTEAQARANFSRQMRSDFKRMADAIRSWTLDGKVGAVWPRNWESPIPLTELVIPGSALPHSELKARVRLVAGDALQVLRLPLLAGSGCSSRDIEGVPPAVANEAFVKRVFKDRQWRGSVFTLAGEQQQYQLTGVVGASRGAMGSGDRAPEVFLCEAGNGWVLLTRPNGEATTTARRMVDVLQSIFPSLEGNVSLPAEEIASSLMQVALLNRLMSLASVLTLGLLLLTQWAAVSMLLASRDTEIAVRMACGAGPLRASATAARWVIGVTILAGIIGTGALRWWRPAIIPADTAVLAAGAFLMIMISGIDSLWWRVRRFSTIELLRRG